MVGNPYLIALRQSCSLSASRLIRGISFRLLLRGNDPGVVQHYSTVPGFASNLGHAMR